MEQKDNYTGKMVKGVLDYLFYWLHEDKKIMSSEKAFNDATYGKSMDRESFILAKQVEINTSIREKLNSIRYGETNFNRYYIVVGLTPIEEEYKDEIFKPFIEEGYKIIDLSEKVEELKGENVYMINWKNS